MKFFSLHIILFLILVVLHMILINIQLYFEFPCRKKFDADYQALQDRLNTLPDKVTHPVMVRIGRVLIVDMEIPELVYRPV